MELFGATLDDISEDDYEQLTEYGTPLYDRVTDEYCRSLGYDLFISGRVRVTYHRQFAMMVVAQSEGLLPKTGEERAIRRLEAEAAEFLTDSRPIRG
jgi:hypothetical protein